MAGRPLRLLVSGTFVRNYGERLEKVADEAGLDLDLVQLKDDPADRLDEEALAGIEAANFSEDIVPTFSRAFFSAAQKAPDLKWVQVFNAGIDNPVFGRLMDKGIRLSTAAGSTAEPIAQTAIGGMLMLSRNFLPWMENQRQRKWEPLKDVGIVPKDLRGQTMVVVGLGSIGKEIARLATAIGLHVIGVRRSPRRDDDAVEELTTPDRLHEVLPRADWLTVAAPLTEETRELIDEAAIRAMPRGSRIMNVGRGEIIDEEAMIAALQDGHLGGAYLDVFATEPLPPESPLWDLPNVIISPHDSANASGNADRSTAVFFENLGRYARGERLRNEAG